MNKKLRTDKITDGNNKLAPSQPNITVKPGSGIINSVKKRARLLPLIFCNTLKFKQRNRKKPKTFIIRKNEASSIVFMKRNSLQMN